MRISHPLPSHLLLERRDMTDEVCNCWSCRFLVPALKEKLIEYAFVLDGQDGYIGEGPYVDEAIDLCEGKVRVPA